MGWALYMGSRLTISIITMIEDVKQETPSPFVREALHLQPKTLDLIDQTRRSITSLNEEERFLRAKMHLEDALKYRQPRIDRFDEEQHCLYRTAYSVQTDGLWTVLVQIISFLYMYLLLFEGGGEDWLYRYGSIVGLVVFWLDLLLELLHSSRDTVRKESRFPQIFYVKVGLLIFLLAELAMVELAVTNCDGRPVNPLRVLRGLLPIVYVSEVRRSFQALLSAYRQFLVFLVFESVVVVIFALVGSVLIQVPAGRVTDRFTNNYSSLGHMIFIVYVTGSYDAFPDNQLLAFEISEWFQIFFLLFVFLNMFLFSSIPGSLLFDSYIETRSKYILLDEIKMQHSLILAFVSLGDHDYEINIQTIIHFLHHLYRYQASAVDAVTQLCLKINDDGNCSVHVLEFIRIGRIWQEHPYLKPSLVAEFPLLFALKSKLKSLLPSCSCLHLGLTAQLLGVLALFGVLLGLACLFSSQEWLLLMDRIISCLLLLDVGLRIASEGLDHYLTGEWNILDFVLIVLSLILSVSLRVHTLSGIFKIVRIFRAFPLLRVLFQNDCISLEFDMLEKFKRLLGTVIIIVPLAARFIPLFLIIYYVLGIAGMEIFYVLARSTSSSPNVYNSLSNFKTLINTQFYLVQVLTQAGWSAVAFDYAARAGSSWMMTLLFFVLCHAVVVLVLAAVLKGIIWFVFITVAQQLDTQERAEKSQEAKKSDMAEKVSNILQVEQSIKAASLFQYDTITKRVLLQSKADSLILEQISSKLRGCPDSLAVSSPRKVPSKLCCQEREGEIPEISVEFEATGNSFLFTMIQGCEGGSPSLEAKEEVEEEDIEEYMNKLQKVFKINTTRFEYEIENSLLLRKHLAGRLTAPYLRQQKEQHLLESNHISYEELGEKKTLEFHIFTLHLVLNMATKRYAQKSLVLKELTREGDIDEYQVKNLLARKLAQSSFQVDQDSIVRQMYLEDTNQPFIDKFEAEYFADIFGPSFKEINKVTIEPLIRLESTLTYAIKKLARSPHINHLEFFKILGEIESSISNRLLKRGSLFKLVYQAATDRPSWFTVHYTSLHETKVTFLKKGLWVDDQHLLENQIYYGKDIFKVGRELEDEELLTKAAVMKKLFESYESMALTIPQYDPFFESNPTFHQYDTYLTHIDVRRVPRATPRPLEVGKIMAVMLTKEQERTEADPLGYPISDIRISPPLDLIDFKIDEAEDSTYIKLGRLFDLNDEEITANEGLPFAYVLNFLCEISDTLKLYAPSFVHQAEKVLNESILSRP